MGDRYFHAHLHFKKKNYIFVAITQGIALKMTYLSWHGQTHLCQIIKYQIINNQKLNNNIKEIHNCTQPIC